MKTLSLKLPDDLDAKLGTVAKQRHKSKSALVRETLEQHFATANGAKAKSCLELGAGAWGSVQGPGDLSTNQRYMEGYGR